MSFFFVPVETRVKVELPASTLNKVKLVAGEKSFVELNGPRVLPVAWAPSRLQLTLFNL